MYKFIQAYEEDLNDEMRVRMDELIQLEEVRRDAHERNETLRRQCKKLFDKRATHRSFEVDDLVLMWNARLEDKGKHGKFDPIWLGPYLIESKWVTDSYVLKDLTGGTLEFPIHGQFLKFYFS